MRISPSASDSLALVGRDRELDVLHQRLDAALAGNGGLVLIGGEAGIGKTKLADTLCREATERGASLLVGRCYDLTETPPYGLWVEAFARYHPGEGDPSLPDAFSRRGTVGPVASQAALFGEVGDFLAAVAVRRPLVLLLEDLHWADPGSLDLLRFLARNLTGQRMLVVATFRSEQVARQHPLYALMPLLVREADAERLGLRPLDDAAVRALVIARYILDDAEADRLIAYLRQRTEGHALYVGETLRALEETGSLRREGERWTLGNLADVGVPPLLRQIIDARVADLSDETQRLLAVAAVIGQEVPYAVWAAVAGVSEEALLDAVAEADRAHIVTESVDGDGAAFTHALVREALYEGIRPSQRRRWHRAAGEALAALPHADPDAVAGHLLRAADPRAATWLVRAGERAQSAYVWAAAAERFASALDMLERQDADRAQRGWLHYRIARLLRLRDPAGCIPRLDAALALAAEVGDAALAAAARYTRGLCLAYDSQWALAIPDIAAGCDALEALPVGEQERLDIQPDARGQPVATNPRGMLVWQLAYTGRIAEAIAIGEATTEGMPRNTPLGELAWGHHGDRDGGLGMAYGLAGRPDAAHAAFVRAAAAYRSVGGHASLAGIAIYELLHVSLPYRTEARDEHRRLAQTVEEARRLSVAVGGGGGRVARIPLCMLAGEWKEARAEAEEVSRAITSRSWRMLVRQLLGELARGQGDAADAWEQMRALLPDGPGTAPGVLMLWVGLRALRLGAALALDAGDTTVARAWMEGHDRWLDWSGALLGRSEGAALWAQYYRQAGEAANALAHAKRALAHATEPRQPLALLGAHRLLGELDTDVGHHDDARAHLDAALALADACAAPYERALVLLARARLDAAIGARAAATARLDEARAIGESLGARPALARAAAIAARLDAARAPVYPAGLSAREVEVLSLLAAGRTNREIAEALFLSEHTVRVHVRHIFQKARADNRAAATAFALRHGLA